MPALPAPYGPGVWTNQPLLLYHGTLNTHVNPILADVQIGRGQAHTDFGQGFYTTTVERQALSWAWQLSLRQPGTQPAVVSFQVDRDALADLECLWFVRGSFDADDFWSLVLHCRGGGPDHSRPGPQPRYDIVIGPVAASWRRRLAIYDSDQVSFHTPNAASLLNQSNARRIR